MEEDKLIAKVRVSNTGQKTITVPKDFKMIDAGDYVIVQKHKI